LFLEENMGQANFRHSDVYLHKTLTVTGASAFTGAISCDDVSFASGAVLNFNDSDITLTHSSGALAVAATWSTAAATGRPFGVTLTANAALGGYSNAIKGYVAYGSSGYTTGLGSAVNAEIALSAGTTQGTYAPLESELVLGTGASTGTQTGFLFCNVSGAAASTFDTNGYMFIVYTGITPAAGKFASLTSQTLRCSVDGSNRYMVMSQMEDGLGLGNSTTDMTLTTYANHAIQVYTTSASQDTGNSVEPIIMESTMTGAGGVGGRAKFYMTTNVALGSWSNALKAHVVYGASGRTTGLGSALCAELQLSAAQLRATMLHWSLRLSVIHRVARERQLRLSI
jgi:hypothetical protein